MRNKVGAVEGEGKSYLHNWLPFSAGEGNGHPLQYSCPENSMDRGACKLQSMGSQRVTHDRAASLFLSPSLPPYGTGRGICLLPGQGVEGVFISSSEIGSSASAPIGSSYHTLCLPPAQGSPVVKAAGRLLSQCRHWERQKQETNCFSSTNIFSFLLLKLDGRPHGEVKRATFSSKYSCSLPGGRS